MKTTQVGLLSSMGMHVINECLSKSRNDKCIELLIYQFSKHTMLSSCPPTMSNKFKTNIIFIWMETIVTIWHSTFNNWFANKPGKFNFNVLHQYINQVTGIFIVTVWYSVGLSNNFYLPFDFLITQGQQCQFQCIYLRSGWWGICQWDQMLEIQSAS